MRLRGDKETPVTHSHTLFTLGLCPRRSQQAMSLAITPTHPSISRTANFFTSVREHVFYVFFENPKTWLYTFLKVKFFNKHKNVIRASESWLCPNFIWFLPEKSSIYEESRLSSPNGSSRGKKPRSSSSTRKFLENSSSVTFVDIIEICTMSPRLLRRIPTVAHLNSKMSTNYNSKMSTNYNSKMSTNYNSKMSTNYTSKMSTN